MSTTAPGAGRTQPVAAGVVTAVVGFASSATVVLAGLTAVGASPSQAASGLLAVCVATGVAAIGLGLHTRMPVSIAWSTPGAALLAAAGPVEGGWPAAVGAFLVAGLLAVLAGAVRPLTRALTRIPAPLASAMLAGVLLPLCLAPVRAVVDRPELAGPVVLAWAVLALTARRWAVVGALGVAIIVLAADGSAPPLDRDLLPVLDPTAPAWTWPAVLGLGVPLFIVTMASQNVPGASVLASFGYRPDLRPVLLTTGALSTAGSVLGGHAINLAAITAALAAGPEAGPDRSRRWIASVTAGVVFLVLGLTAGLAAALIAAAPPGLVATVAGVALLGTLGSSLAAATAEEGDRDAAIITFVVSASAISVAGVTAPFWGLVAGLAFRWAARRRAASPAAPR